MTKFSTLPLLLISFFISTANAAETAQKCDFFFNNQNLCASLQWLITPTQTANGSLRLAFWNKVQDSTQSTILVAPNAASVAVKLEMPGMGHGGGLVKVDPTRDSNGNPILGEFDASQVFFVMPGAWQIIVQLKDTNGADLDSATLDYQAP